MGYTVEYLQLSMQWSIHSGVHTVGAFSSARSHTLHHVYHGKEGVERAAYLRNEVESITTTRSGKPQPESREKKTPAIRLYKWCGWHAFFHI